MVSAADDKTLKVGTVGTLQPQNFVSNIPQNFGQTDLNRGVVFGEGLRMVTTQFCMIHLLIGFMLSQFVHFHFS